MKSNSYLLKIICLSTILTITSFFNPKPISKEPINSVIPPTTSIDDSITDPIIEEPIKKQITLSFVGDCTLGTDDNFGYARSFTEVFDKNNGDYGYFFKNVKDIFEADDLTIANLETTFTNATKKRDKQFTFKGDPSYTNILLEGNVDIVNLANNHAYDYFEKGFNDTTKALDNANIGYYGNNIFWIDVVKGVKIGLAGFTGFGDTKSTCIQIEEALKHFDEQGVRIKIISFHWGIERENYFNNKQEFLGKCAIDNGADLVIGHHPHVLQGVEKYSDTYIVYSLGNFVFGGNKNPYDKDSMIFQKTFYFEDDKLIDTSINIIPVSISSQTNVNDYQPYPLEGDAKIRVLNRINKYSKNFKYK